YRYGYHRDLHSFPTRRSSDLQEILNYYKTQEYPDIFPDVNWLDEFTNDYSTSHRENLSIRGGTKFVKYYGSLSYLQQGDLIATRSEEHTSELQSRENLVCRLL